MVLADQGLIVSLGVYHLGNLYYSGQILVRHVNKSTEACEALVRAYKL